MAICGHSIQQWLAFIICADCAVKLLVSVVSLMPCDRLLIDDMHFLLGLDNGLLMDDMESYG